MGQKINPIGFRLSVNRNWSSKWFANTKNFPGMLLEDIRVREYLEKLTLLQDKHPLPTGRGADLVAKGVRTVTEKANAG